MHQHYYWCNAMASICISFRKMFVPFSVGVVIWKNFVDFESVFSEAKVFSVMNTSSIVQLIFIIMNSLIIGVYPLWTEHCLPLYKKWYKDYFLITWVKSRIVSVMYGLIAALMVKCPSLWTCCWSLCSIKLLP